MNIQELRSQRFEFLHKVYVLSKGSSLYTVNYREIAKDLGWPLDRVDMIVEYLVGEGLVVYQSFGGNISITHPGVVEVEAALECPEEPTEHFPPTINIITVETMVGSQIQQGTVDSSQSLTITSEAKDALESFLAELRSAIPSLQLAEDDCSELIAEAATIEAQLGSSRPKPSILRASLGIMKRVLEGAGVAVALELTKRVPELIGLLM